VWGLSQGIMPSGQGVGVIILGDTTN